MHIYHRTTIDISTVMMPQMPIASPLIAPSTSPSSIAFDVPTAMAGRADRKSGCHRICHPKDPDQNRRDDAARIPVPITATTVMGTMPPAGSAILTAMGVVTDFGISDTSQAPAESEQTAQPVYTQHGCCRTSRTPCHDRQPVLLQHFNLCVDCHCETRRSRCQKMLIISPPALYESYGILKSRSTPDVSTIAMISGLHIGVLSLRWSLTPIQNVITLSATPKYGEANISLNAVFLLSFSAAGAGCRCAGKRHKAYGQFHAPGCPQRR